LPAGADPEPELDPFDDELDPFDDELDPFDDEDELEVPAAVVAGSFDSLFAEPDSPDDSFEVLDFAALERLSLR
jgi:hypothetical protein